MKIQAVFLLFSFTIVLAPAAAGAKLTARQIAEKAWWAGKLDGAEMISTLTIINAKGQKRIRKTAAVSKLVDGGHTEKRLIRFLSPADVKGTGLLSYDYEKKDDDIWFFLPSLRKTRRIVSSEKAKSFMGSEFTYADTTPPSVDDFKHKLLKEEKVDGTDCYLIVLTPKNSKIAEENGFSKRMSWFGKKDFVIRKSITWDLRGRKHRQLRAENVKEIDPKKHRFRAMRMTVKNLQDGRSSVMDIGKIKLRSKIPDKYFTTRYLERF
jgi:outer membrane lipoprotein-sorting protein